MLIIRAVQCIQPEVCSNGDEVFRGIVRDRYVISHSKAVRLDVSKLSSVCDAGVNCREFCFVDSLEWNFFEVKKVFPYHTSYSIQESPRRALCSCYKTLQVPLIDTLSLWYHGFINKSVLDTGGKHV